MWESPIEEVFWRDLVNHNNPSFDRSRFHQKRNLFGFRRVAQSRTSLTQVDRLIFRDLRTTRLGYGQTHIQLG